MTDDTTGIDGVGDDWAAALAEQKQSGVSPKTKPMSTNMTSNYKKASFDSLENENTTLQNEDMNMDVILDIPVTLSVEIGRSRINIRNLLQLNQGSVVELDRLAGEPMDVLVNGTLIAHGEVVVVNEKFGVRLTDVISASERVKKLK